jgi:hypothetical protein
MHRRIAMIGVIVLGLAVTSGAAFAGKGGGGNGGGGGGGGGGGSTGGTGTSSSSISVATINGVSAAGTTSPAPKLGDSVTFNSSSSGLAGWEYPMIAVSCYQDVNGDGAVDTNIIGPDVVYTDLEKPTTSFTLGNYMSIWTLRGGGSALCRADLDAYGFKSGVESTRVLASTAYWTAAG